MLHTANAPLALVILDGWGYSPTREGNAIAQAHTPFYDAFCADFPFVTLAASGPVAGQAEHSTANAEVGHLNIGTGRRAEGEVFRVEEAIRSGSFQQNEVLRSAVSEASAAGTTIHLIGMISDGGVHSSSETLFALLRMAKASGAADVAVHCILDGVDVSPRTADVYIEALEIKMADIGIGRIASLCGRYFAMDAGGNWERTARVYTMLVHGEGERSSDAVGSVRNSFLRGISDEFTSPIVIESSPDIPVGKVKDGDTVIFFNHRPETMRQLVRSLAVPDSAGTPKPDIKSICMTEYDRSFDLPVAFAADSGGQNLTDALGNAGIWNVKITQTERFPHLTYFLNGGCESSSTREQQVLVPTPRNEPILSRPESQSFRIADQTIRAVNGLESGVFIVNLPAAGLVAAAGASIEKTVEAVQFVDTCLGGIVEKIRSLGGTAVITSSHGRCEQVIDPLTREPAQRNSANPVPLHIVGDAFRGVSLRENGSLSDVAPTVLAMLDIETPSEMTGRSLVE